MAKEISRRAFLKTGTAAAIGYLIPMLTLVLTLLFRYNYLPEVHRRPE